MSIHSKEYEQPPWLLYADHFQQIKGSDPFLCSALVRHIWSAGSNLGFLCKRERRTGAGPRGWLMAWGIWYMRRGWKLGVFSVEQGKFRGILSVCKNIWWRTGKKVEVGSSQWCLVTQQETMDTNWNAGNTI